MNTTINHLKKDESLSDMQLVIINSADRDNATQNSSSFTYTFNKPLERISKADIMYTKIPKTFYNVNNDNATMSITTQTFTDTKETILIVDDVEMQNNIIDATNITDTSVLQTSLYNANSVIVNDIVIKNTFMYTTGSFSGGMLDFYNSTNASSETNLTNSGIDDVFVAKYTLDQLLQWRFKIAGTQNTKLSNITVSDDYVFVTGVFNSFPINFYNADNTTDPTNDLLSNGNYAGMVAKYDLNGNFVWGLRLLGLKTDTEALYSSHDELNGFLYIAGTFNADLEFYDTSNTQIAAAKLPAGSSKPTPNSFIAQYDLNGVLLWRSSIQGECKTTSTTINPDTNNIIVAVEFSGTLEFYDSLDVKVGVDLVSDGDINICIVEYDQTGAIVDRFKIGGSGTDVNAKLTISKTNLYITGSYTSNPVKFYDTVGNFTLNQPNTSSTTNIFTSQYSLAKIPQWSTTITSVSAAASNAISYSSNDYVYVVGAYNSLVKFNDINGHVTGQDLSNDTSSSFGFLVKYDTNGNFINRSYISSTQLGDVSINSLDATSINVYAAANFTNSAINLYNADNLLAKTISNLGTQNSVVVSYVNTTNNYDINKILLNKTIISKKLTGVDLNYTLNLNAFAQSMGFIQSQKFKATVFGGGVSPWTSQIINSETSILETVNTKPINGTNNTLTLQFSIGDLSTGLFTTTTVDFIIDIYTNYTQYSLAFQLNKVIKTKLKKSAIFTFNQDFEPVVYNSATDIFYIQFNINGTFAIQQTDLSNNYLKFLNTVSQHVIISDELIENSNILITNNTKLTLKATDDIITEKIIDGTFADAFPTINEGNTSLKIMASSNQTISAQTGNIDSATGSDIQVGDKITFESPWIAKNTAITQDFNWKSIAMSADGVIQTAVNYDSIVYGSVDSGFSWNVKAYIRSNSVAMSANGKIQTIVGFGENIYVSTDTGNTWLTKGNIKLWYSVAMSADGETQTAVVFGGAIWQSVDTGNTWAKFANQPTNSNWQFVAMSANGTIQTAVERDNKIWQYENTGNPLTDTWTNTASPTDSKWRSVAMSADGTIQTVVVYGGGIWQYDNLGATWAEMPNQPTDSNWRSVAMSTDGKEQTAVVQGGKIWYYTDTGNPLTDAWVDMISLDEDWVSVAVSADGLTRTVVVDNGNIHKFEQSWNPIANLQYNAIATSANGTQQTAVVFGGYIYTSNNSGNSWRVKKSDGLRGWQSVAISADGTIQTAVESFGKIWQSDDSGDTWTDSASPSGTSEWQSVAMSADGTIQTAVIENGKIWQYENTTNTWTDITSPTDSNWKSVAMSADGTIQTAVVSSGYIYTSNNSGNAWVPKNNDSLRNWQSVDMSADGTIQTAVDFDGKIWQSDDSGDLWTNTSSPTGVVNWRSVAMSADGTIQTAVVDGGKLWYYKFISNSWAEMPNQLNNNEWESVTMSADGIIQSAVVYNGNIYIINNLFTTTVSNDISYKINNLSITNTYNNIPSRPMIREWKSVAMSADGTIQTALFSSVVSGAIWQSDDSGDTWTDAASPLGVVDWQSVAMSANGTIQTAVVFGGKIWQSNDSGDTWTDTASPADSSWQSVDMSADGTIQTAVVFDGKIWQYANTTNTWAESTTQPANSDWKSVAISADGTIQTVVILDGSIYVSTDTGDTWENKIVTGLWSSVAMSADGTIQTAVENGGKIQKSIDSGDTWTDAPNQPTDSNWISLAMSADGTIQTAVAIGKKIYVSIDAGDTWTAKETSRNWYSIAMSMDGLIQTAVADQIYVHTFAVDRDIVLNVKSITTSPLLQDVVYFEESANTDPTLSVLNNFNMVNGDNYTILSKTPTNAIDVYIPSGNYTSETIKTAVNKAITDINPTFTNAFDYDAVTGTMTFTSIFGGGNAIKSTNLLNQLGFVPLPTTINKNVGIVGNAVVNTNLSGPSNLFIKSDILGNLRKNPTGYSSNKKLKNIIAPLTYEQETNSYKVIMPIHLFFSKKSTISYVDIQIVDENGNIVNLNMDQNNIELLFYFYSS
jgi:photosystem II stability/assembly factor-like uncharacterized protein